MKPKHLTQFLILLALEGAASFVLIAQTPSAQQHIFFAGLSGQRLILAAVQALLLLVIFSLGLRAFLQPSWVIQLCHRLDGYFSVAGRLTIAFFLLVTCGVLFVCLTLVFVALGWGRILERLAPIGGWLFLAYLQFFFLIQYSFKDFHGEVVPLSAAIVQAYRGSIFKKGAFWLALAIIIAVGLVLVPSTTIGQRSIPTHDSGIFLYFGRQILNGQLPYRELWDHKPPLIFYIDALGLLLGEQSLWGVWFVEFCSLALAALLAFILIKRYFSSLAAAVSVAAVLANLVFLFEGGNLTEEYALPLQWGTLLLAAIGINEGWRGRRGMWAGLVIGLLFSIALSLKQTMVGVWISLALFQVLLALLGGQKPPWRIFGWAGIGVITGTAGWVLYFALHGALAEFWNIAYIYNFLYSDIEVTQRGAMLVEMFSFFASTSGFFIVVIAAWVIGCVKFGRMITKIWPDREKLALSMGHNSLEFPLLIILIDMIVETMLINTSGKNYRHYFISLLPACSVLVGWLVHEFRTRVREIPPAYAVIGGLVFVGSVFGPGIFRMIQLQQPSSEATIQDTVKYIQAHTRAEDFVLMWGSQTTVNFLSERQAPTRFVHQKPLFRKGYANAALSAELLKDLAARKPELIINTHLPSTPFINMTNDGACQFPQEPQPEGMDAVFDFICQNYELETIITKDNWEIFRYRP